VFDAFATLTPRQSVNAAERDLKTMVLRYQRLCKRRNEPMSLNDAHLMRCILKVLPKPVAGRCRELVGRKLPPSEMFARARIFEEAMTDDVGRYPEPSGAVHTYPVVPGVRYRCGFCRSFESHGLRPLVDPQGIRRIGIAENKRETTQHGIHQDSVPLPGSQSIRRHVPRCPDRPKVRLIT
jgi:hypothetical protein